jgi:hypothetical protein
VKRLLAVAFSVAGLALGAAPAFAQAPPTTPPNPNAANACEDHGDSAVHRQVPFCP